MRRTMLYFPDPKVIKRQRALHLILLWKGAGDDVNPDRAGIIIITLRKVVILFAESCWTSIALSFVSSLPGATIIDAQDMSAMYY